MPSTDRHRACPLRVSWLQGKTNVPVKSTASAKSLSSARAAETTSIAPTLSVNPMRKPQSLARIRRMQHLILLGVVQREDVLTMPPSGSSRHRVERDCGYVPKTHVVTTEHLADPEFASAALRSANGTKRTKPVAALTSANDPKRTPLLSSDRHAPQATAKPMSFGANERRDLRNPGGWRCLRRRHRPSRFMFGEL